MPVYRKDEIVRLCRGRSVLHLGFIQHRNYLEAIERGAWLHGKIVEVCDRAVGIDYLADEIGAIQDSFGYECYFGDAMDLDSVQIAEEFDVIVCGELIEHIENPGQMLRGLHRFMHSETKLIITTPNPWNPRRMMMIVRGRTEASWLNTEHVAWYTEGTLSQLLERMGYFLQRRDFYVGQERTGRSGQSSAKDRIRALWGRLVPSRLHDGLFFVAVRDGSAQSDQD